ncbi:MAG TPA: addiction module protein [Prosthecobacter sp.]
MNLAADLPEVLALPVREKLLIVDEIWASIAGAEDELEVSGPEKQALDERWERFEQDPSRGLSVDDFRERLKARRA